MAETKGQFSFMYGRREARIRLPQEEGMLSAFWILCNDGDYAEIDVAEMVGHENNIIYGVNHYTENRRLKKISGDIALEDTEDFHVYGVERTPEEIRWYAFDDMLELEMMAHPPRGIKSGLSVLGGIRL